MLISCPNCVAVYNIAADDIPEKGRRFKCIECGNVWTVYPGDARNIEPENHINAQIILPSDDEKNAEDDVKEMFQRLSRDTDNLFAGNEKYASKITDNKDYTKQPQRALDRQTSLTGLCKNKLQLFLSPFILNSLLLVLISLFTAYIGYHHRHMLVRYIPVLENVYNRMEVDSLYTARDVIFDNLTAKPLTRGRKHYIEISGRMLNIGKYKVHLLPIKAEMRDNEGKVVEEITKEVAIKDIAPQMSSIFFFVIENKTPTAKNVKITFLPNREQ